MRTVSLLPAATEIVGALGLMDDLVAVSHECDFPDEANRRPRVTHCEIHGKGLDSQASTPGSAKRCAPAAACTPWMRSCCTNSAPNSS